MLKKIAFIAMSSLVISCSSTQTNSHVNIIGHKYGDISISDMRSQVNPNKLIVGQAVLTNTGSDVINGYYRCQFLDANGFIVGETQIWQMVAVYPNSEQAVKCLATDPTASSFKLEFSIDGTKVLINNSSKGRAQIDNY